MQRSIAAATGVLLLVTACGSGSDNSAETNVLPFEDTPPEITTTTSTTTTTITAPDAWCAPERSAGARVSTDLDADGSDEVVYLMLMDAAPDGASAYQLGVCADGEALATLDIAGRDLTVFGFADLSGNGYQEILLRDVGERGARARAAALTLRGLELTSVDVEEWIDGAQPPAGPFHAAGFECADIDADGDIELLSVSIEPADDLLNVEEGFGEDLVHVAVAVVGLDGVTVARTGIDAYETGFDAAYARWSDADRCAPGSPPRVVVDFAPNGWGWVDFDPSDFESDGNVVLTGVARGGADDRFVAVGVETSSLLLGGFFPPRPAIWSSEDARTWVRADLGESTGELRDVIALADGSGFVAAGRTGSLTAAVWLSTDGRTWELIEIPPARAGGGFEGPVISQLTETPQGLVGVGMEDYIPEPGQPGADLDAAIWISPDGREWERIEDPAFGTPGYQANRDGEFNAELVDVAFQPTVGIVAVGSASASDPTIDYPLHRPAIWRSADGRTWQRHDLDHEVRLRGITPTTDGMITYGVGDLSGDPQSDAVVLTSHDGIEWSTAGGAFGGIADFDGIQSINRAVEIPGVGLVALGSDEKEFETMGGAAAWWSDADDPMTWVREAHDDRVFTSLTDAPTATMTDAVWADGTLVVVGFSGRWTDADHGARGCCIAAPAIWMWTNG